MFLLSDPEWTLTVSITSITFPSHPLQNQNHFQVFSGSLLVDIAFQDPKKSPQYQIEQ